MQIDKNQLKSFFKNEFFLFPKAIKNQGPFLEEYYKPMVMLKWKKKVKEKILSLPV